jgi:hypothetical protein
VPRNPRENLYQPYCLKKNTPQLRRCYETDHMQKQGGVTKLATCKNRGVTNHRKDLQKWKNNSPENRKQTCKCRNCVALLHEQKPERITDIG